MTSKSLQMVSAIQEHTNKTDKKTKTKQNQNKELLFELYFGSVERYLC